MRQAFWIIILAAVVAAGCREKDENPHWNPRLDYPEWTYDAPLYYRPSQELPSEPLPSGVEVFYSNKLYFFIKHPGGYQVRGEPRVAVWGSGDQGAHWERAGFFGVEQTHFLFKADHDGRYWIRFVGPGQEIVKIPPGSPHRIYVVDRSPPKVAVDVIMPTAQDSLATTAPSTQAAAKQTVSVSWSVQDEYLDPASLKMEMCFGKLPQGLVWGDIPRNLPPKGTVQVELPAEAQNAEGLRFRLEASDKAGNVGLAVTEPLAMRGRPASQPSIRDGEATAEGEPNLNGWPRAGELLRGGASAFLTWMPPGAGEYELLELQFSADDGRNWRTLVSGIRPGSSVKWIVPAICSKTARLRIVGLQMEKPNGNLVRIMLATSGPFVVDTLIPDTVLGPEKLPEPAMKEK